MLYWNKNLYMDDKVKKHPERFRKRIERRKLVTSCYCITIASNSSNCMDIYCSRDFWFQYYRTKDLEIIGLAATREGAEEILQKMVQDIFQKKGKVDFESVSEFFEAGVHNR